MQPPTQSEDSRPPVCRRLFADDEDEAQPAMDGVRDNMLNQINEEISRDLDDACKKYNFDFRAEEPLEGNWVWERVVEHPLERRPTDQNQEVPPVLSSPQDLKTPLQDPPAPQALSDPQDKCP